MEHVVFYQSSQGTPAFRRVSSLDDAVSFAEHLRNVEGVTDFSVYSLAPVTLSMRAYYHVEVTGGEVTATPSAPAEPAEPAAFPTAAPQAATPPPLPPMPPTPVSPMSLNALEADGAALDAAPVDAAPVDAAPVDAAPFDPAPATMPAPPAAVPFAAAPLPPPESSGITETFVKDDPAEGDAAVDPGVVDPTTEEVVPGGRRSMGFFARS